MNTKTEKKIAIQAIKNEIAVQDLEMARKFADDFSSFGKMTAHALIGMGKAVFDAKESPDSVFTKFCELTSMDPKGSTVRKYIAIGRNHARLEQYIDALPNNWTTIYKICSLTDDEFDTLVESKVISPSLSAKTINQIIMGDSTSESTNSDDLEFTVTIPKNAHKNEIKRICQALNMYAKKEHLKTNFSTLEKFFSDEIEDITPMPITA